MILHTRAGPEQATRATGVKTLSKAFVLPSNPPKHLFMLSACRWIGGPISRRWIARRCISIPVSTSLRRVQRSHAWIVKRSRHLMTTDSVWRPASEKATYSPGIHGSLLTVSPLPIPSDTLAHLSCAFSEPVVGVATAWFLEFALSRLCQSLKKECVFGDRTFSHC